MNNLLFLDEAKNNWRVLSAAICRFVENSLDLTGHERSHDEDKAWLVIVFGLFAEMVFANENW